MPLKMFEFPKHASAVFPSASEGLLFSLSFSGHSWASKTIAPARGQRGRAIRMAVTWIWYLNWPRHGCLQLVLSKASLYVGRGRTKGGERGEADDIFTSLKPPVKGGGRAASTSSKQSYSIRSRRQYDDPVFLDLDFVSLFYFLRGRALGRLLFSIPCR